MRDCSREQKNLYFIFVDFMNFTKNLFDFLFKALLKNFISFIQAKNFKSFQIYSSPADKIIQSAWSTNKNINTSTESSYVILNTCFSINTVDFKIFLIFELEWLYFIVDLDDKFSCRKDDKELWGMVIELLLLS